MSLTFMFDRNTSVMVATVHRGTINGIFASCNLALWMRLLAFIHVLMWHAEVKCRKESCGPWENEWTAITNIMRNKIVNILDQFTYRSRPMLDRWKNKGLTSYHRWKYGRRRFNNDLHPADWCCWYSFISWDRKKSNLEWSERDGNQHMSFENGAQRKSIAIRNIYFIVKACWGILCQ